MLACSAAGALAGYTLGRIAPGDMTHGQASAHDAGLLGFAGYSIWAVLDVTFFAYRLDLTL